MGSITSAFVRGDPFEGRAAKRQRLRLRIEGLIALTLAIVACGLTSAVWIAFLVPGATRLIG